MLFACEDALAQKTNAFATVKMWPRTVYPKQPIKVTIEVFSPTWFAEPLDFENLVVGNCFIVPFTRTIPSVQYINKKQYSALTFYYLVFPYTEGELVMPSLTINASIPLEGDYNGRPVVLKTKSQTFKVKPVPDKISPDQWFVANNVYISEKWSKSFDDLKVGDMIERTIIVKAIGTLPGFIPDLAVKDLSFASVYPKDPEFDEKRSDKTISGIRTQKILYLFEDQGSFVIPEVEIAWWNSYAGRMYSKKLPKKEITVSMNDDLGILTSIKDSLEVDNNAENQEAKQAPLLTKKRLFLGSILIVGLVLLSLLIILIVRRTKKWAEIRQESEKRAFDRLLHGLNTSDKTLQHQLYYDWLQKINCNALSDLPFKPGEKEERVIQSFLNSQGDKRELKSILSEMRTKILHTQKAQLMSSKNSRLNP